MKSTYICLICLLVTACKPNTSNTGQHSHHDETIHHQSNNANEHMHKRSTEELISSFESPERDAYQKPEKVLENLGSIKGKTIIDIGTGSGYFAVRLAKGGAKVIAADVDDEFLTALEKRVDEEGLNNIELKKIPYDDPLLVKSEVDIALVVNTYHHIEDRSKYFSKVRNGIKNNGELVIIDFFKTEGPVGPPIKHKISIDQVVAELRVAGYKQFNVDVDLLPYQYIIKAK